ncbi:MAG: MFS transporter [Planctomycetota bacterium]|nr:MAG: MFS transporter [Planctomycetota bacterium]
MSEQNRPPDDQERLAEELSQDVQLEERAVETLERRGAGDALLAGHPPGLFLLFVTEMWERFSYYGMRGLLTLFLIAEVAGTGIGGEGGGFGFTREQAGKVYGWYTSLVYLTPIFGGMLADKLIGTHRSMVIGGVIIAMGHGCLALIDLVGGSGGGATVTIAQQAVFYLGLGLIILGTGFFKPCVSVMVGQLYREGDPRRDAGFTIFYMGINVGAFLGGLLCAWLANRFGWWAGFGAAGVGMVLGLVAYFLGRPALLQGIGLPPQDHEGALKVVLKVLGSMAALGAVVAGYLLAKRLGYGGWYLAGGLGAGLAGIVWFVSIQEKHERGPTTALFIIAFFVIFFWYAFEQAGSSLNVFAQQRTDRSYERLDADGVIQSKDLGEKWKGMEQTTFHSLRPPIGLSESAHGAEGGDDVAAKFLSNPYNVGKGDIHVVQRDGDEFVFNVEPETTVAQLAAMMARRTDGELTLQENDKHNGVTLTDASEGPKGLLVEDARGAAARDLRILSAKEFPAAWYQSLNPFYILVFAPVFAFLWGFLRTRRLEPHTAVKMGYGLVLLGLGFVFMVIAARFSDHGRFIPPGAVETPDGQVQLSLVGPYWLALTYLLHTWGELCLSPIGLSLTTKLAPRKWVSFMMGVWFLAPSIAQLVGGYTFAYIEPIERGEAFDPIFGGQADFFFVFVVTSIGAGLVMLLISPVLKRLMKGHE